MAATDDYDEIAKVIETYIEGAKTGDVGLLFPIFHEKAQLFGEGPPPGKRWDLDRDAYLKMQAKEPLNKGGKYRARLVSVKQMGPSATRSSRKTAAGASFRSSRFSRCRGSTAPGRSSTRHTRTGRTPRATRPAKSSRKSAPTCRGAIIW